MSTDDQDRELGLIIGLCRELVELGLNDVGLSDARPAVVIRTSPEPLWIRVDVSGEFFEWSGAESQHPVADLAGAAALISGHVRTQRSGPGAVS